MSAATAAGMAGFADDSGLAVAALGEAPGVHSARWAGEERDFRSAMESVEQALRERGRPCAVTAQSHFVSRSALLARPACRGIRGQCRGYAGLAASGRARSATVPHVPAGWTRAHVRRNDEAEKHGLPRQAAGCRTVRAPFSKLAEAALGEGEQNQTGAFGVYIHWPFCLSKCPYCDFNSHVRHAAIDEARFARAFCRRDRGNRGARGQRTVSSIFLGGGTPSLMAPKTVADVLDAVAQSWVHRARRRDFKLKQSDQRRGAAVCRLSMPPE